MVVHRPGLAAVHSSLRKETMTAATSFLAGLVAVGAFAALAIGDPAPSDPRIASVSEAEVCAGDGLPGSAYSRAHRTVRRPGVAGYQIDHVISLCAGGADN